MIPIEVFLLDLRLIPIVAVFDNAIPNPLAVAYFTNFLRLRGVIYFVFKYLVKIRNDV